MPNATIVFILLTVLLLRKTIISANFEKIFLIKSKIYLSTLSRQIDPALIRRTKLSHPVRNHAPLQIPRIPIPTR